MSGTLTLFRVRGIPVRVHVSWLVVFGLIAWSLASGYSLVSYGRENVWSVSSRWTS
jgi:Zn-dependent protease